MSCDHCDHCPSPLVMEPRAFRRLSERVHSLAQRLECAISGASWAQASLVYAGLEALLADCHMCRVGNCPCTGRNRNDPVPYVAPELE